MGSVFSRLYNSVCNKSFERNVKTCVDDKHIVINNSSIDSTHPRVPSVVITNRKTSMDVTKHNFLEILQELDSVLSESDFITIDTELSGLRRLDAKSLQLLDTICDRYVKLRQSICGFSLIQFGLTCFRHLDSDSNDGKYVCHSYNFYIFPQKSSTINKSMGDRVFSVQTSSLQFLANNGFDFNRLIIDGISYLNDSEEKLCLEIIKTQNDAKCLAANSSPASAATSAVTDEDKKFVEEILTKVREFIADESQQTLDLSPCNGFKRRLIYETIKAQDFIDCIDIKTVMVSQNSIDRYISISKVDKLVKERKDMESLTEAIGFTKVIQLIIKYQKPMIGHNLVLDLMHTFNQFIEPLPQDYQSFKQSIHALFPIIYDTKYISSSQVFKDKLESTALGDLYERVKKSPFVVPEVELKNGRHIEGRAMHEAGYDSYMTGVCFVSLVHYLGALVDPKITRFDQILLTDYQNKLYLTYSHDIKHMDFEGEDIVPNRDHVFHVTFPKEWKTTELFHLFSAFGGVVIGWISDTSALCALKDPSNADKIKKSLVKQSSNTYKVISYKDFIHKSQNESNCSQKEDNVETNKRHSKRSPYGPSPYKKTKVIENKTSDKKQKIAKIKQKLFEEPNEWEVE